MTASIASFPPELVAPGTSAAPFVDALGVDELSPGGLRRVTFGDLDVLLAHTPAGIVAVDDRCPHMSAPLSLGELDGCVVGCPLHRGRFDLCNGDVVRMPTTGGLLPDGTYVPVWSPEGQPAKVDVPGLKADARRLTRVRRLRYYPLRVRAGRLEIRIPPEILAPA
jgi:nitrite reductase/ring-hydroxylating ferredoxin subunit